LDGGVCLYLVRGDWQSCSQSYADGARQDAFCVCWRHEAKTMMMMLLGPTVVERLRKLLVRRSSIKLYWAHPFICLVSWIRNDITG
jgi:hypothetical protein